VSISFRSLIQVDVSYELLLEEFVQHFVTDTKRTARNSEIDLSVVDFKSSQVLTISSEMEIVITKTPNSESLQSYRVRTAEVKDENRWVTHYSIHQSVASTRESSLVVEIDSPLHPYSRQPMWPQIPRLLSNLLEQLEPLDLGFSVHVPKSYRNREDAPKLISYLGDSKRRSSLLIAVNPGNENWDEFSGLARQLLNETGGTATAVILDSKVADYFNELVPEAYAISREFFRIFNPQLNFGENYQAHRHRKIPLSDLDDIGIEKVAKEIAAITRGNANNRSFPLSIQKRESAINSLEQNVLAHGKRISPKQHKQNSSISNPYQVSILNPDSSPTEISNAVIEFKLLLGKNYIEPSELVDLAMNRKRLDSLALELSKLNDERDDLILTSMQLREDLDEEALGRLELFEQKSRLDAEIRYLRESLVNTRSAELAYESMPEGQYEPLPLTFQEVLTRVAELAFVTFTGDPSETTSLDDIDTGSSAPHCWEYLQVLDDYGRAKVMKAFDNNFMQFLKHTPSGFRTISSHKYAPVESEQTANRKSLLEVRTFNVPYEVDPSGRALMEAHLKLSRRIRIHFLDDTRETGQIYVGYIGNHLPLVN
jgi:hypothetical protein